ncbi:hypothetical protein [Propionivibrio sp.]|uniref:hypothetical protein n=1 Tax=Propionivibrio sp. TaxID=2212460 RepID=UPI0025F5A964|nr:hypothetical protein [Propionivibrio sp.]MBK7357502.1 hypothetical protein [Propionivibrio sp.]
MAAPTSIFQARIAVRDLAEGALWVTRAFHLHAHSSDLSSGQSQRQNENNGSFPRFFRARFNFSSGRCSTCLTFEQFSAVRKIAVSFRKPKQNQHKARECSGKYSNADPTRQHLLSPHPQNSHSKVVCLTNTNYVVAIANTARRAYAPYKLEFEPANGNGGLTSPGTKPTSGIDFSLPT